MTTQGLIPRYTWRNERAKKNVFERADKMEHAFVLHLDPSDSGTRSKMKASLLTSSSEALKKSNYFQNTKSNRKSVLLWRIMLWRFKKGFDGSVGADGISRPRGRGS